MGRITQKTETVQGVAHTFDYTYNPAGYLVEVARDAAVQSTYTYDLNGNRQNNSAAYDDQDRLTSTATATYTYTDNGELLTKTEGALVTQYTYDVVGNLKTVVLPSGTTIEYVIDANDRRIGRKVDGTLEKAWLYKDGLNPIAELDGAGNVVSRFVYASRGNVPDYVIKGGVTYRIISDHLGSPRLVINSADGTIVEAIEYDDWGNVLSDTNPGFLPFGYAGGLYDADTKLVRFGARDYDPETGRWTAKDPIRFDGDGTNLYGYVLNDPINFVDVNGEYAQAAAKVALAGLAAYSVYVAAKHIQRNRARMVAQMTAAFNAIKEICNNILAQEGNKEGKAKGGKVDTLKPGPNAKDSVPGHRGRPTATEQKKVNEIMKKDGCHTCGTKNPGTKSGNAIADHQPPQALGQPKKYYPHCINCSRRQGGQVRQQQLKGKKGGY